MENRLQRNQGLVGMGLWRFGRRNLNRNFKRLRFFLHYSRIRLSEKLNSKDWFLV